MKNKIYIILTVIFSLMLFAGCGNNAKNISGNNAEKKTEVKEIKLTVPDGLPAVSVSKLVKENDSISEGYKVNYTIEKSTDSLSTSVMKKEPDIAIVPSNMAAAAYNKTNGQYIIAGTTGWGSMYICSTNTNDTIENLKGTEIYNIGKGLTPDIVTKTILKNKGFNLDNDVNFSYVNGVNELAPIIISGKTQYAVLPEPALSTVQTKKSELTTVVDLNSEWKTITGSKYGYPQATIIIKKELIDNDKEFVIRLLNKIDESIKFAYSDKEKMAQYCEEIGVSAKKPVIIKSMDKANIKFISIKDSYNDYEIYFNKLKDYDVKTLGGKVPDEQIFMEK